MKIICIYTQTRTNSALHFQLQKRNCRTNCCIVLFPVLLCLIISVLQHFVNDQLKDVNKELSKPRIYIPPKYPPLLQVPKPQFRATQSDFIPFTDLPDESCKQANSCPATILVTGSNQTFAESMLLLSYYDDIAYLFNARVIHLLYFSAGLTGNMFMNVASLNFPNNLSTLGDLVMVSFLPGSFNISLPSSP